MTNRIRYLSKQTILTYVTAKERRNTFYSMSNHCKKTIKTKKKSYIETICFRFPIAGEISPMIFNPDRFLLVCFWNFKMRIFYILLKVKTPNVVLTEQEQHRKWCFHKWRLSMSNNAKHRTSREAQCPHGGTISWSPATFFLSIMVSEVIKKIEKKWDRNF